MGRQAGPPSRVEAAEGDDLRSVMGTSLLTEGGRQGVASGRGDGAQRPHWPVLRLPGQVHGACHRQTVPPLGLLHRTAGPGVQLLRPQLRRRRLRHGLESRRRTDPPRAERPASAEPSAHVPYGTGNAHNSWYACNIVDSERPGGARGPTETGGSFIRSPNDTGPRPVRSSSSLARTYPTSTGAQRLIPDLPERIRRR